MSNERKRPGIAGVLTGVREKAPTEEVALSPEKTLETKPDKAQHDDTDHAPERAKGKRKKVYGTGLYVQMPPGLHRRLDEYVSKPGAKYRTMKETVCAAVESLLEREEKIMEELEVLRQKIEKGNR